jgi:hypothetical protein
MEQNITYVGLDVHKETIGPCHVWTAPARQRELRPRAVAHGVEARLGLTGNNLLRLHS